jgi:hypothetical protein
VVLCPDTKYQRPWRHFGVRGVSCRLSRFGYLDLPEPVIVVLNPNYTKGSQSQSSQGNYFALYTVTPIEWQLLVQ